jgi:type III pantothenate kinase
MLLTIDVGNTSTACAVFREKAIIFRRHLPSAKKWSTQHLALLLKADLIKKITAVIISSVVPRLDRDLAVSVKKTFGVRAVFLNHRTATGITLKIDKPAELGADRIAGCAGALTLLPPPLIVIDSGTAITFDLLNEKKEYCGGCILPGIGIAVKSLAENTAKLKHITFALPASPVGTNTVNSVRAGIYFGCIGSFTHLIACYREILGQNAKVVATGGLIRHFKGRVPGIDLFAPDLLFYGLKSIYDRNKPPK